MDKTFVAVKRLYRPVLEIQPIHFGLEMGNGELGSMPVNDLRDYVPEQNDER